MQNANFDNLNQTKSEIHLLFVIFRQSFDRTNRPSACEISGSPSDEGHRADSGACERVCLPQLHHLLERHLDPSAREPARNGCDGREVELAERPGERPPRRDVHVPPR